MADPMELIVRGRKISVDANGLLCLNDIQRAAGFSKNRRPSDWTALETTRRLIEVVIERITGKSGNWTKSEIHSATYRKIGASGGTFADPRLALAYAEYLNPKLALEVREVFLRYRSGDATLADEILERASAEANEWAGRRALSRAVRKGYTGVLAAHGVSQSKDYAACTNATYQGLFGQTAKQLKQAKGVTGNLRDSMDLRELAFVMAAEALSSERIEGEQSDGPSECQIATSKSARFIRSAIEADRKDRSAGQKNLPF